MPLTELMPEEADGMQRAVEHRVREYRAGRHCARAALERLGASGVAVPRAKDRSPMWPEGFAGSISHTQRKGAGFCGAVVCKTSELRSVGLDVELDVPLDAELFSRVMDDAELAALSRLSGDVGDLAKVVFSAKECVYKLQYPLSRQFLEFKEVRLELDLAGSRFRGILLREAGPLPVGTTFDGTFARRRGLIFTALSRI